jgi:hypothetical protein
MTKPNAMYRTACHRNGASSFHFQFHFAGGGGDEYRPDLPKGSR